MAWASLGVAAIGAAGKVASSNPGAQTPPTLSGDAESFTDNSGWVVNFGHGSGTGMSSGNLGGNGVPLLWIAIAVAVYLLRKKA